MPKLYELIPVEGDLKGRAQQSKNKITKLFAEGFSRLVGRIITYQVDEGEDSRPPEIILLGTTIQAEMSRFEDVYSGWLNVAIQKEVTNQETAATVKVGEDMIFDRALPTPALLNLEAKLTELKTVYAAIPTLDPSARWEWDEGQGHYVSDVLATNITKKVPKVLVLAESTEHHPAQVQGYNEDVKVGTRTTVLQSGLLAPKDKRKILDRLDLLIRAVKEARQRANDIDIVQVNVAKAIFKYLWE